MNNAMVIPARLQDAAAIAAIYNQGIIRRRSTLQTDPATTEGMRQRIVDGQSRHPLLVAWLDNTVIGWASLSAYSTRPYYAGVGECSVYVDEHWQGHGVGRLLLDDLVARASTLGYWKLMALVFADNTPSLALCRTAGFREVGVLQRHGCLAGRWMDVVLLERGLTAATGYSSLPSR